MPEIVIIGAGIVGLYTALVLSRQNLATRITVYAKFMPGDRSIEYTSPYAGGNFSSIAGEDALSLELDKQSFISLKFLFEQFGKDAGLDRKPITELWDRRLEKRLASMKTYVPDLVEVTDQDYLASKGATFGIRYTTYNFYAPFFLKFLYRRLADLGVTFIRREIKDLRDAFDADTQVVFNCAGLMASKIGGVNDDTTYPIRGQICVVRAPHIQENMSLILDGKPPTYIIPRPFSNGQVILGGYYDAGDWTPDTFAYMTGSILDRTTRLMPQLLDHGPLEILDERAGLRPGRKNGPRIERDYVDGRLVVHNYGAAGVGYQTGLGMALKAVGLYLPRAHL